MSKSRFFSLLSLIAALVLGVQTAQSQTWVHPGVDNSQADLARIKQMVNGGVSPWRESWNRFSTEPHSSVNWTTANWGVGSNPGPVATPSDPTNGAHYYYMEDDASAAYQNALEWYVTGNVAYATQAIKIINTWATTLTSYNLNLDITGYIVALKMSAAAEILRYETGSGWTSTNTTNLTNMLNSEIYPSLYACEVGQSGIGSGRPGDGNQGIGCARGIMAMSIFTENRTNYNWALSLFEGGTVSPANPCVAEVMTTVGGVNQGYIDANGSPGESGRDQAHPQDGIASYAEMAKMSEIQGTDDLWAWGSNRLLSAMEYEASYNLGNTVTWSNHGTCYTTYSAISTTDRGLFQNMYEMAYQHYVTSKGLSMPYTAQVLALTRSEPYWSDDTGWGTLLYTLNAVSPPVYDGVYEIANVQSGLALDTVSGGTGQGVKIVQDAYTGTGTQQWMMIPYGNEYYGLYPKSGSATYTINSGALPSVPLDDIDLHSGISENAIWWMHSTSGGIQVVARDSRVNGIATNIAWDVSGGSYNSGVNIITNDVANEAEMMFSLSSAYTKIQASSFNSQSGTLSTQTSSEGGMNLDNITNGTWSEYNSVYVQGATAMDVRVATAGPGGATISVYEGSTTGTLLGTGTVNTTGGAQQYGTITIPFTTAPSGTQNLYLVYTGGSGHLFNFLWFVCY